MSKRKRKRWFVDRNVQKGIMIRLFGYWLMCMLFITLPLALIRTIFQPEQFLLSHVALVWQLHWPIFLSLALLLPFGIYDSLKFSNRFAGPIFRLRRELQHFADCGSMRRIQFRETDFWSELADGVNLMSARIDSLEKQLAERNSHRDVELESVSNCS